jgi:hypothetical protein
VDPDLTKRLEMALIRIINPVLKIPTVPAIIQKEKRFFRSFWLT